VNRLRRLLTRSIVFICTVAFVFPAFAQQKSAKPCDANPPAWNWLTTHYNDEPKQLPPPSPVTQQVHEAATRFIANMRLKEGILAHSDGYLAIGAEILKRQHPGLSAEFLEEWPNRVKTRLTTDKYEDYEAIWVREYEKYFTAEELDQLTDFANQFRAGNTPPNLPDALNEKVAKYQDDNLWNVRAGERELLRKLGCEVAEEILSEHPDWDSTPASRSTKSLPPSARAASAAPPN
jgi:hypothetical protein